MAKTRIETDSPTTPKKLPWLIIAIVGLYSVMLFAFYLTLWNNNLMLDPVFHNVLGRSFIKL